MKNKKVKAGRPSLTNGKTKRVVISMPKYQKEFLIKEFGSISEGVRFLIDREIEKRQKPKTQE